MTRQPIRGSSMAAGPAMHHASDLHLYCAHRPELLTRGHLNTTATSVRMLRPQRPSCTAWRRSLPWPATASTGEYMVSLEPELPSLVMLVSLPLPGEVTPGCSSMPPPHTSPLPASPPRSAGHAATSPLLTIAGHSRRACPHAKRRPSCSATLQIGC